MGSCISSSRIDRQELVSRCRARKNYVKNLVQARRELSLSHSFYLRSLRSTGAALLLFASGESSLHLHRNPIPIPIPSPPPSVSPSLDTWTTTASTTTSSDTPPPPPPQASTWDFWDPFIPGAQFGAEEEEWEDAATTTANRTAASVAPPPKEAEMAVVSGQGEKLEEIVRELDEYFVKAADAGDFVSGILELPNFCNLPNSTGKVYSYGRNFSFGRKLSGFGFRKLSEEGNKTVKEDDDDVNVNGRCSHSSTLDNLYAWEKKLLLEVKNAEKLKMEYKKKVEKLKRVEVKEEYMEIEKWKKEVEGVESLMEISSQAIKTTSAELIKLRETQLYPQLLDLVKGFMCMWRSMYECHQVQTHIVDQLKFTNSVPSTEPTSEIHRQSTLQLETELQKWHQSFCDLYKAHRDYISSLTGWLRLSLFEFDKSPSTRSVQDSFIYSMCEEWQLAIDRAPDKVASEGIKSLLSAVHDIVVQQAEELKQGKKLEHLNKELDKRTAKLRSLEVKYGPYSMPESGPSNGFYPGWEKKAKVVERLKAKAEEEKEKYDRAVSMSRAMTLNNMQMELPHVFQAITGFSNVCMLGFESVYNQGKSMNQEQVVNRLMKA